MKGIFRHRWMKIALVYYVFVVLWWLKIYITGDEVGTENYYFNFSYIFFNLLGGFGGLIIARKKWGGFRSKIGRGLSFLGIGQLSQGFGLAVWTYYNFNLHIEVPYPSIADFGYHFLIPAYIYGMYNFALASGTQVRMRTFMGKAQAIFIPALMLAIGYALYLRDLPVDLSAPLRTYLDWGTPLFNAISVSIGILTYSLSAGILGGKMKKRILLLVVALIFEYITEYGFLYRAGLELYYNAGPIDLMFATSAFLMTLGIFRFENIDD